jgi:hypothetical protein
MMENEIVDELIHRCPHGHAYKKSRTCMGLPQALWQLSLTSSKAKYNTSCRRIGLGGIVNQPIVPHSPPH